MPKGWKLLGSDLSGIELRMLAHYLSFNDDGEYAKQILDGDIHTYNQKAAGLETRDQAKTMIYALCYGASDKKMGEIIGGNAKDGKALKQKFYQDVPAFSELLRGVSSAVSRGYLKSLDGRRVKIRSAHSALNTLLQSAAGIISKKWICLIQEEIIRKGLQGECYMMAWVHDEIQIACKTQEVAEHVGRITRRMAKKVGEAYDCRIAIDSEYSIGKTWADSH